MHIKNKIYFSNENLIIGICFIFAAILFALSFTGISYAKYYESFDSQINLGINREVSWDITFNATSDGYFPDSTTNAQTKIIPQIAGSGFSIPESNPQSKTEGYVFSNWYEITSTGEHIDWTDKLKTLTVTQDTMPYNNTLYAQYRDASLHKITVQAVNSSGTEGKISWTDESGSHTEFETVFYSQDLVGGQKLNYNLNSEYTNNILSGYSTFMRGSLNERVFSTYNGDTGTAVFSRVDIVDDQGKFPGWEGVVNGDVTISFYFVPASYQGYWVANQSKNNVSIETDKTYTIESYSMYFFCDGNKEKWDKKSTEVGENKFLAVECPLNADIVDSWGYTSHNGWKPWKTKCTRISIDESFKNFPLQSTMHMFDSFSKIDKIENIENISVFGVKNLSNTFNSCSGLQSADLSRWDVRKVTNASFCFNQCTNGGFQSLNVSNWNFKNCTNYDMMFSGCKYLEHIYVENEEVNWWTAASGRDVTSKNMFESCNNLHNIPVGYTASITLKNAYYQDTVVSPTLDSGFFETLNAI